MEKKHQNNLGMRKELQIAKSLKIDSNTQCQKHFLVTCGLRLVLSISVGM